MFLLSSLLFLFINIIIIKVKRNKQIKNDQEIKII